LPSGGLDEQVYKKKRKRNGQSLPLSSLWRRKIDRNGKSPPSVLRMYTV
jgi:hypothetical protein